MSGIGGGYNPGGLITGINFSSAIQLYFLLFLWQGLTKFMLWKSVCFFLSSRYKSVPSIFNNSVIVSRVVVFILFCIFGFIYFPLLIC